MGNALLLLEIIERLIASASRYAAIARQAQSEGRDVSDAEVAALQSEDNASKAKLDALIAAKRAGG